MSKYTPATFQPTVRPDWAGILSYLSDKEKIEILTALFKYPSETSENCQSAFWKEVIKPDLDLQYQVFTESCKAKSRGVRNRWGKISITDVEDMNKTSIRYGIDTEREREDESKKESEVEKRETITEETIFKAGGQSWTMPMQFRKLAKKYWTESEIREIEINHSCHEDLVELSIKHLLASNPPKQKQEDRTLEIQFNTFWEVYPKQRKAGKTKPREKFFQIVKSGKATAEQIIKSAEDYAKTDEVARGFAKEPYSWLLNERYLCDYTIKQTVQTPMTAKERIDMINKQKTEMLLKQLKAQGN